MIRKITLAVILIHCWLFSLGQNQYSDSLISILTNTTNPIDRFDLLNNILLDVTSYRGDNVDSLATMQLLQIAQEQNIDSLKAIAYNWLGTYFYQQKGDNTTALEYYFKAIPLAEKLNDKRRVSSIYFDMALVYFDMLDNEKALEMTRKGGRNLPDKSHPLYDFMLIQYQANLVQYFLTTRKADSAFYYAQQSHETLKRFNKGLSYVFLDYSNLAASNAILGNEERADEYFIAARSIQDSIENITSHLYFYNAYIPFLMKNGRNAEGLEESRKLLQMGLTAENNNLKMAGASFLRQLYENLNLLDSAYYYSRMEASINAQIFSQENKSKIQSLVLNDRLRSIEEKNKAVAYQNKLKQYGLIGGLCMALIIALILFRNNRQKQKGNRVLKKTLSDLKATQSQLIQSEKMASLGELTAGIAHEIQNPLNFVNNFSEVSAELIDEMNEELDKGDIEEAKAIGGDLKENLSKINHHGKRAGDIVKGMLQHSRVGSGKKEITDINELCDEYLRLAYHGLRAKDKSFNSKFETDFDTSLPKIDLVSQDMGRVLLNLINNAFYAVNERAKLQIEGYEPQVVVSTHLKSSFGGGQGEVLISVKDNGNGIPDIVKDKIFQPFFTTKPTGSGTGLGLSLSYDIVKAHGGELKVESEEVKGTEFILQLPLL